MGVDNIITFDAHDPRVQNAIPLSGFETVQPAYQFIKALLTNVRNIKVDSEHLMVISPDEGGMGRAVYLANVLGIDMGMFYKRRDYARIVNGRNPIDVARQLKALHANRIFLYSTFGLFTNGMEKFDEAYKEGLFDRLFTTNLVYQSPELLSREYYISCDMSKYIALLIDTLNHDASISDLLDPFERIHRFLEKYKGGRL